MFLVLIFTMIRNSKKKCPKLTDTVDWVIFVCQGGDKPYIPSPFQLQEYCMNKDHYKCPFLLKQKKSSYSEVTQ